MQFSVAVSFLLAGLAVAAPARKPCKKSTEAQAPTGAGFYTADIILKVAPSSSSCSDTATCRTAAQVAPLMNDAAARYSLTKGQAAGVLALEAFESVEFKYKQNISPGRPGQGTANMQMYNFNLKYAQSIDDLKQKAAAFSASSSDAQKNELLALVTDDQYNFGSGPWFLTTQCGADVQAALSSGSDAGFQKYMQCVGVSADGDRLVKWQAAKTALGL